MSLLKITVIHGLRPGDKHKLIMTSLNNIHDTSFRKNGPEVLIEFPDPKLINDNCTIIMNGHHNYGMNEEKESGIYIPEETEEEVQPFLNHSEMNSSGHKEHSTDNTSTSNMFPLKEATVASSAEEESEGEDIEQESSTHLLQNKEQVDQSPKCLRNKAKLPTFKSSPSRKQTSDDPHSHIQHRPLGVPQDTMPDHIFHVKRYWPFTSMACLFLVASTILLVVAGLAIGLYFAIASNCNATKQWWQGATMYEIFPASFQDTDGDGFGDIKGLISRLDYIQNLSISVIRLNSIFSALDYPLEYEHAIDFANIDPHLGRMEDFQNLVKEIHCRGMYVILDMNPTATSDQHTWAAHWLLHRPGPFQHFYINITEEEGEEPPYEDNPDYAERKWTVPHRTFGNHLFLNWSNPLLQLEMRSILELWLSQGVDGFYMKHLENLHVVDTDHIALILHQWRQVLDSYSINDTKRVLIVSDANVRYLQNTMDPLTFTAIPPFIDLVDASLSLTSNGTGFTVREEVEDVLKFWTQFAYPPQLVWHTGGVETMRLTSRIGPHCQLTALFLKAVLPGSFSSFYGDEIGMMDSFDFATKEVYRGGQLAPMQWTSGPQANFTAEDATPWLPVHPNYFIRNVASQTEQLELFAKVVHLKDNGDSLFPTTITRTSIMHTLAMRFSSAFEDEPPEHEWHQNRCGLLIVRIVLSDVFLFANFGMDTVVLDSRVDSYCAEEGDHNIAHFTKSARMGQLFAVVLSTNSSIKGEVQLRQISLEPGLAIIGRFIT